MTLFKPRIGKVIFAQTTGGLSVIIQKKKKSLINLKHLPNYIFIKRKKAAGRNAYPYPTSTWHNGVAPTESRYISSFFDKCDEESCAGTTSEFRIIVYSESNFNLYHFLFFFFFSSYSFAFFPFLFRNLNYYYHYHRHLLQKTIHQALCNFPHPLKKVCVPIFVLFFWHKFPMFALSSQGF